MTGMVLVDSSVWIQHLHRSHPALESLLLAGRVACHPFVLGELACGVLRRRGETLRLLSFLPQAASASHDEAVLFVERHRLFGAGLGWIDVNLAASACLSQCELWTLDRRLAGKCSLLHIGFEPPRPPSKA